MEGVQGGVAQPGCRQVGVQGGGGLHVDVGICTLVFARLGVQKCTRPFCTWVWGFAPGLLSVQGGACTFGVLFCTHRRVQGGVAQGGVGFAHLCACTWMCVIVQGVFARGCGALHEGVCAWECKQWCCTRVCAQGWMGECAGGVCTWMWGFAHLCVFALACA